MTLRYALPLIGGLAALSAHAQPTLDTDNIPAQGQEFPVRTVEAYSSTGPIGATQSFHFWNMLVPATGTRNYRYFNASITPTAASLQRPLSLVPMAVRIRSSGPLRPMGLCR